jgi:hypothetical protein
MDVMWGMLLIGNAALGQDVKWVVMARGGSAYNFKTPLVIKQQEEEVIRINAKYATKPFHMPPYYEFQISRWHKKCGWGFKVTHHKLYLQNNPPTVQRFTITDGYNLLTITRQWKVAGFIYHLGAGGVFTHPESIIRNQKFSETEGFLHTGYHLSGPIAETALEKRIDLSSRFILSFEGRATASYIRVPVFNGTAKTSNIALHGLAGVGYKFYGKK